jgi:transposase
MRMTTPTEVRMRGDDWDHQGAMWSYVPMEQRIPADHPLRVMRPLVDGVLRELSPRFAELYSRVGRPSIAPEKLLRALLLQVLYTIRSERLLMEQLDYNLLFRWFVGLEMDDPVWNATVFTKNRERLLGGEIARAFFDRVGAQARERGLLSDEHFTVDGTLVEAWASLKSFKRKDAAAAPPDDPGNPTVNFHGERRGNTTHASTTDPDARLARKGAGQEAKLGYTGHVLMENRNGLAVGGCGLPASGYAERAAAWELLGARDRGGASHARGRQGVRPPGLRRRRPAARGDSARGAEHHAARPRDRRPDYSACGLRGEPAAAQARRGDLRLAQDSRAEAQDPAPRHPPSGLDVYVGARRLHLGAYPKPHHAAGMTGRGPSARAQHWPTAAGDRRRTTPARRRSGRCLGRLRAAQRTTMPSSSAFSAAC